MKAIGGKIIGREIEALGSVDSTNDYLQRKLAEESLPEGWVVTAGEQSKGRGQRGAVWHSTPGKNILMSTVLYPAFLPVDKQFSLSMAMALGVSGFLKGILPGREVKIKWPNDILVEEKKVSGILIENSLQANILKNSIVGIGINVNEKPLADTAWPAACLADFKGVGKAAHLIPPLCDFLDLNYSKLKSGNTESIHNEYLANLYAFQEERNFIDPVTGEDFTGSITGIDDFGRLLVKGLNGEKAYSLKEIQFRK